MRQRGPAPVSLSCRGLGAFSSNASWDQPWVQGRGMSPPRWCPREKLQDYEASDRESRAAVVEGSWKPISSRSILKL